VETCSKCQPRKVVAYRVEPAIAWKTVVLNRRRILCAFCFDVEAEKPGVANTFTDLEAQSWSGRPTPLNSYKRKR
jgi:hypothetical protein